MNASFQEGILLDFPSPVQEKPSNISFGRCSWAPGTQQVHTTTLCCCGYVTKGSGDTAHDTTQPWGKYRRDTLPFCRKARERETALWLPLGSLCGAKEKRRGAAVGCEGVRKTVQKIIRSATLLLYTPRCLATKGLAMLRLSPQRKRIGLGWWPCCRPWATPSARCPWSCPIRWTTRDFYTVVVLYLSSIYSTMYHVPQ